jgi:D-arabinose 5-phosphate isomerase GutQ
LFISYSGSTPELLTVLDHVPDENTVLAVTQHTRPADCPLLRGRPDAILLPAPIHEPEEVSFGVCAPTTSTTVAIAVGDMLALTLAEATHQERTKHVFQRNHPGGAIGANAKRRSTTIDMKDTSILKRRKTMPSPS